MVDLDILVNGEVTYSYCRINGEYVYPAYIVPINEFYRVETKEGCVASYRVPFTAIHLDGSVLEVDEPKTDKRITKRVQAIVELNKNTAETHKR